MICREYKKINELFNQVNDVAVEMCGGGAGPRTAAPCAEEPPEPRRTDRGTFLLCINVIIAIVIKQAIPLPGVGQRFGPEAEPWGGGCTHGCVLPQGIRKSLFFSAVVGHS